MPSRAENLGLGGLKVPFYRKQFPMCVCGEVAKAYGGIIYTKWVGVFEISVCQRKC